MGQKAHPYGLRLGYIKPWKARWFARRGFEINLHEDLAIRNYIKKNLGFAGISNVEIERSSGRVRVRIYTARPGVIIGRRGQEIDKIKDGLGALTPGDLFLDIKEVKSPQTDAQLVAENIALQLEKRIGFRRAMKKAVQLAMSRGALGIKVACKGRLGGSEIAREEKYREGKVPLSTFRADVNYGFAEAMTTYGKIGCKVWIYKGDVLIKKEDEDRRVKLEAALREIPSEEDFNDKTEGAAEEKKSKKPRKKSKKEVSEPAAEKSSQPEDADSVRDVKNNNSDNSAEETK